MFSVFVYFLLKSGVVLHLFEINYVCFHLFCSGPCQLLQEKGWERFVVYLKAANWSSHQDVQIVCMSFCFLLASSHHLNFPHLFCPGFSISYDLQVFNSQYTSLFQATIYTDKIVDKLGNIWKATEVFDKEGCVLDIIWHVIWRQNDHKNDL